MTRTKAEEDGYTAAGEPLLQVSGAIAASEYNAAQYTSGGSVYTIYRQEDGEYSLTIERRAVCIGGGMTYPTLPALCAAHPVLNRVKNRSVFTAADLSC